MLIYLAHPIDNTTDSTTTTIRQVINMITPAITNAGHHIYHPAAAFKINANSQPDHTIERINDHAQKTAQAVIVIWPQNSKSWGVPVEIERALKNNQPVLFLHNQNDHGTWSMPTAWDHRITKITIEDALQKQPKTNHQTLQWLNQQNTQPTTKNLPYIHLDNNATDPTRAYPDDAGIDLYVSEQTTIQPGQFQDIKCSIAVQMDSDTWGFLTGRSSTLRKHGLMVNQGIIDPGYRGELYAGVFNLSQKPVTIEKGERLAQLILMTNHGPQYQLLKVDQLTTSDRGENGFGSSGR